MRGGWAAYARPGVRICGIDVLPEGLSIALLLTHKYFASEAQLLAQKSVTNAGLSWSEQENMVRIQELIKIELV